MSAHKLHQVIIACSFFILFLFFFSAPTYAYLNPGTGSYFFQILIASFIGGLFALKIYWRNVRKLIKEKIWKKKS